MEIKTIMIVNKKSVVYSNAYIVPEGEEVPLELAETKTEPMIVADVLWMPYDSYKDLKHFIYSREDDILNDEENFGALFSVLQWINRMENDLRTSNTKANGGERNE